MTDTAVTGVGVALRPLGGWTTVYADVSKNVNDPAHTVEVRVRGVLEALEARGAPDSDVARVRELLGTTPALPDPLTLYALVREGEVVHRAWFPGRTGGAEVAAFGDVPVLEPLLKHAERDITYLVAVVERADATVSLRTLSAAMALERQTLEGSTENLSKVGAGGWAELNYQHRTEEIWKRNQGEVADLVNRMVDQEAPAFVVVAGDVHARQLLISQLGEAASRFLVEVDANVGAAGASDQALEEAITTTAGRMLAERRQRAAERLAQNLGERSGRAAVGLDESVAALQRAQVDVLLIDSRGLRDRQVLAIDAVPWVATTSDVIGKGVRAVAVPAFDGLTRAALLTDADVTLVTAGQLPDRDAGVAAVLRWG